MSGVWTHWSLVQGDAAPFSRRRFNHFLQGMFPALFTFLFSLSHSPPRPNRARHTSALSFVVGQRSMSPPMVSSAAVDSCPIGPSVLTNAVSRLWTPVLHEQLGTGYRRPVVCYYYLAPGENRIGLVDEVVEERGEVGERHFARRPGTIDSVTAIAIEERSSSSTRRSCVGLGRW